MQHRAFWTLSLLCSFLVLIVVAGGCGKKVAATPPAPPPRPPALQPTVTMAATPTTVNPGQTVTLSWSSANATDLDIAPGVGKVATQGSTPVTLTASTTYTITATGPGGSATASAHVNVGTSNAGDNTPLPGPVSSNVSDMFNQSVKDIFFDLDKSEISAEGQGVLTKDAEFLRSYPQVRISLEGHCDERGSTEYNLGLGQRRAEAAKNYMVSLGISADRIETVSWGKERPFCTAHDESCWHQNRRAHFVMAR